MFKVGDKAKGFKFDGVDYPLVGWDDEMDDVVGVVGKVSDVGDSTYSVSFEGISGCWAYPTDLWYLGKIEETTVSDKVSFNVGEDVPFKIGDKVKFKKSSIDSGMIGASADDTFTVLYSQREHVMLQGQETWWNICHLEHVKESVIPNTSEAMNNTEEQEIKWEGSQIDWQVGQEVFCLLRGKGVVECVGENDGTPYVVGVDFGYTFDNYTIDGKIMDDHKGRVLFFSEPKIEAEKFPPKKPFVPKLKEGDTVIYRQRGSSCSYVGVVDYEDHDSVTLEDSDASLYKHAFEFHKLGEEIIFN